MANGRPTTLDEYCRRFDISFFDLRLPCIFCFHPVDLAELASFYIKKLSLVFRGSCYYACCSQCLRLSAKFEQENYFQCSVYATGLEDLVGQKIRDICVRCLCCLKLLDIVEKLDLLYSGEVCYLIRGLWRGYCRNCIKKQ
ncbi:E6 protein [Human papillomavirus 95]|uniref:Protein E6 n=1 Tax=Human papillomavirus 95 TaxID=260716 RepID=Q705D9_9PAPI|nr:E6 protein [Human papillomavirus 95]